MKSDSFKSIFIGPIKEISKDSVKSNIKDLLSSKAQNQINANNLSFDTSLIKCFCKKDTPEQDKTSSNMVKIL